MPDYTYCNFVGGFILMGQPTDFLHDVFISYRLNDNKPPGGKEGDGWVTEFVRHLSTELETIVKGRVSIYFDKNPKYGLQETHHVDTSLSAHLNSLIFMPVLSQTYCDSECYTWKHELLPFLEQLSKDPLGSMIKIQGGNVASRVMPIIIHELDAVDLCKIETQLNSKLRAISFVYRSPGVNRPMWAHEDNPLINLNRIHYPDQVNKVANAVREIINSTRIGPHEEATNVKMPIFPLPGDTSLILNTQKTIAVLPLNFQSANSNEEYLSQGFAEDLFNTLKQIKALRLSIFGLSSNLNRSGLKDVSSKAALALTGSMQVMDSSIRLFIRLVNTRSEAITWGKKFECDRSELFFLKTSVVEELCNFLGVSRLDYEEQVVGPPLSLAIPVIDLLWKGKYHWRKRGNDLLTSLDCYQKAADLDTESAMAFAGIACTTALLGHYEMIPFSDAVLRTKEAAMRCLAIDPTVMEAYFSLAYVALCYELGWPEMEQNFRKVFSINPNGSAGRIKFSRYLTQIQCAFEDIGTEPLSTIPHFLNAYALLNRGKFAESLNLCEIGIQKAPESFMTLRVSGLCYLALGYYKEAIDAFNSAANLSNRHPMILFDLVGAYASVSGNTDAQGLMEEAMQETSSIPAKVSDFFFQPA